MSDFGSNLQKARKAKNISQGKFAEMVDLHPSHISRYERGLIMPSIELAKKFAEALDISIDHLVYGTALKTVQRSISDADLFNMFIKTQTLSKDDVDCVKKLLTAFLFQKAVEKQLAV